MTWSKNLPALPAFRVALALLLWLGLPSPVAAGPAGPLKVHFAFSEGMFHEVNENDAKAAMKVYCRAICDDNAIDSDGSPIYLDGTNAIGDALRSKQVDMLSLTSEEFITVEDAGLSGPLILSNVNGSPFEEFVILTRADSPVKSLANLAGHSLVICSDLRSTLAPLWLEVICRQASLPRSRQFFSSITYAPKPTQVVLPVFFNKIDACLVTRNGWAMMGELNPQVKSQLRSLAISPPVVPGMSCFRRDFSPELRQRIIETALKSGEKPAFKQIFTLFKCDKMSVEPESILASTRQLVWDYAHLASIGTGVTNLNSTMPSERSGH